MTRSEIYPSNNRSTQALLLALTAVVVFLTILNVCLKLVIEHVGPWQEYIATLMYGAWAFESIIFGGWVALGFGAWTARMVITIPCVLLLYVAPALLRSTYAYLERVEFFSIAATTMLIFAGSIVLLSIVRKIVDMKIEPPGLYNTDHSKLRFSTRHLLATIAIYALLLGLVGLLDYDSKPSPFLSDEALGYSLAELQAAYQTPSTYFFVNGFRSAVVVLILLPILALPAFLLKHRLSKRGLGIAVLFWFSITVLAVAAFVYAESVSPLRVLIFIILCQLGAAISGIVAALPLRVAGCQLRIGYL